MSFTLNGKPAALPPGSTDPAMPLLWVLRDALNLTGTKYGCGIGACGACTVRIDGEAKRSCVTPLSAVVGRSVQTIEGLAQPDGSLHAVQSAWLDHQVPQCGYCQSGLLMAAATLIERKPRPTDAEIDAAITNLCRCGTTPRVRAAVRAAGERLAARTAVATPPMAKPRAGDAPAPPRP